MCVSCESLRPVLAAYDAARGLTEALAVVEAVRRVLDAPRPAAYGGAMTDNDTQPEPADQPSEVEVELPAKDHETVEVEHHEGSLDLTGSGALPGNEDGDGGDEAADADEESAPSGDSAE